VAVATRGFPKLIPVLIAVIVGYVSAIFMGKVNFSAINSAAWIGMPHFVLATFKPQAIFLIAPVVIMLIAENIGHVKAISAYMGRNLDDKVGDAFMGDGLSTMLSGFFGGTGQTTYAENIGVMSITKIYSIYPLRVAAIFAILLGLIPKFGALVQSIPAPVMGGITLVLFGMIAGAGASVIAASSKEKTNWSIIESFGVFGVSIAVCAALIATFTANGAINAALPHAPALPTTLKFGFVQLDAIGGSTFFAVILNFAIVVAKKYSPFSDK
jgi:xanthine/uracil permease